MPLITHFGSVAAASVFAIFMIALDHLNIIEGGIFVPISLIVSQVIIHTIKIIINRPRPNLVLQDIHVFDNLLEYYSFPSGHTAAAFAIAVSITFLIQTVFIGQVILFIAILVGISRMYIGVHYPTDVLIGAVISFITVIYLSRYLEIIINLI
ncbi:MAG: phosphatase PAP2 family protein [Firmicutes bacterium HGW-Firmicutes-7]|nr:MAG: phosphatase PAP2 family protein [Firmicutes bacterium HGW-Firmicutes-7]